MASRARVRAWLSAAVAVVAIGGVAVVATPSPVPAPLGQSGEGRPMGAVPPVESSSNGQDSRRAAAVADLLARRADALLRRDEDAFLATVDPRADPTFLAAQRAAFANIAAVPLSTWEYRLRADDALDLAPLRAPDADPTAELWAPGVELSYGLRDIDPTPTTRTMGYLFAKRDGQWYLRSDTALADLGRQTWRGPWDFGPCLVFPTQRGLVLAHPGNQPMVDRLARELDASVDAVRSVWGQQWTGRVALFLPDGAAEMSSLVGPDFPIASVVAVAIADRVDTAAGTATGQRVVFNPMGSRALSASSLRIVLRHEITHVAARTATVDGAPMWLLEGFADYVGYRDSGIGLAQGAPDLAKRVRESGPPGALPEDRTFRGKDKEMDLAYQQAWSLARFVAERFGEDRLVALYRLVAGAGPASAGETDDLLRRGIGMDRATLLRDWQAYLRTSLR